MSQAAISLKYEFINYLRSRRFVILIAITAIIGGLFTFIVARYRPLLFLESTLSFYSIWWGQFGPFVIILSAVFFGGDAISGEFQNKTGYFLVPNPIRRSSIYIGKWLSAFLASSLVLALFALIAVGNQLYYFGADIPFQFGESALFAWIYLAAALGCTFFFSSSFKSSSISILVTVILLLFVFSIVQFLVADEIGIEPWFLLTYGAGIISAVLTTAYPPHALSFSSGGITLYTATVWEGLAIMGAYFLVTSALGLAIFERREFT